MNWEQLTNILTQQQCCSMNPLHCFLPIQPKPRELMLDTKYDVILFIKKITINIRFPDCRRCWSNFSVAESIWSIPYFIGNFSNFRNNNFCCTQILTFFSLPGKESKVIYPISQSSKSWWLCRSQLSAGRHGRHCGRLFGLEQWSHCPFLFAGFGISFSGQFEERCC